MAKTDALISLFVADDIFIKPEVGMAQSEIIDIEADSDLGAKQAQDLDPNHYECAKVTTNTLFQTFSGSLIQIFGKDIEGIDPYELRKNVMY